MLEINKIYNMDCLEGMKQLEDNSIDLTVTSPPYDNLRKYKPIGYSWNFNGMAKELYRVTKIGGVVVWIVGDATINGSETGTSFKQALYFKDIGFNLHDTMIYKSGKPPLTHRRYEQCFEYMFIFIKNKIKTFNPILKINKHRGANALRNSTRASSEDNCAMRDRNGFVAIKEYGIINNIWEYSTGGKNTTKDKIAFQHPAIFPEQLAKDHITSWSNEGDLILDPFMGSGTTAKMAFKTGRNYIGFELSKEYCYIAEQRIKEHTRQLRFEDIGVKM